MDSGQIVTLVILIVLVAAVGLLARRMPVHPAPSASADRRTAADTPGDGRRARRGRGEEPPA